MLVSCGGGNDGSVATERRPQDRRPAGTVATSDPGLPVHVELAVDAGLEPGATFPLTMSVLADEETARARGRMTASGSVEVVEVAETDWNGLQPGQRRSATATLHLAGRGPGEIRGTVEVLGPEGSIRFSATAALDVLVTATEVLTGTSGPLALELDHLEHEREAGRITEEQFSRLREEVLGRGATQTG